MYYVVYALLYLLSLIPWRIMYILSDGIYGILYYVVGYRKDVVMKNLLIAFPEKTDAERKRIAKTFYHNFVDTFMETLKLFSVSKTSLQKRFICNDFDVLDKLYASGQNVQIVCGHFFSWEFANRGIAPRTKYKILAVYIPLSNKIFDKIMLDFRSKFGSIMIPASEFKTNFQKYTKELYALALAADQAPAGPEGGYWTNFFNTPTPFVRGPEKGAKINNAAVVFANFYKVKRGYYKVEFKLLTTMPRDLETGVITKLFVAELEKTIRGNPGNYLWSHKRWKWEFDEEKFGHLVV
jgi:Kdo2-lipid IVA lauroyltransferase/acyltransferase